MSEIAMTKNNGRERLMEAALNLFSDKGYHATSVREISEHARINVSQISFYFGGKQGLLNAIFEDLVNSNFNDMITSLKEGNDLNGFKIELKDFLSSFITAYAKNAKLFRLFWDELERGHEEALKIFPETFGRVQTELENYLTKAREKGFVCNNVDTKLLALQILSPFISLMAFEKTARFHSEVSLDNLEIKERLITQTIEGIVSH